MGRLRARSTAVKTLAFILICLSFSIWMDDWSVLLFICSFPGEESPADRNDEFVPISLKYRPLYFPSIDDVLASRYPNGRMGLSLEAPFGEQFLEQGITSQADSHCALYALMSLQR
jgi:hypothetical protein